MHGSAPVRIGVVGLGAVAQAVHLPLIARRPDLFAVAGICDLSTELLNLVGDRYGVAETSRFTDLDKMLDGNGVEALLVLTKGSHVEQVLAGFAHDLPVFCEKPLAFTVAEADQLIARRPNIDGPALLLGYMKQYDPAVLEAVRLLEEVDDVRAIEVTVLHPTGASQLAFARLIRPSTPLPPDAGRRFEDADRRLRLAALGEVEDGLWSAYRTCLIGSLAHDLSVLRSLGTPPGTVDHVDFWREGAEPPYSDVGGDRGFGSPAPSISVAGTLAAGGRFNLAWHYLPEFPAYRETVRVFHGRGAVELTFPSPYLLHAPTELTITSRSGEAESRTVRRSITEAFESQLEAFHAMVRDGVEPKSDLWGGRTDIVDCQRIIASYADRNGIPLGGEVGQLISGNAKQD